MSARELQIGRISTLLLDGLNTALHGAPQAGKSWVADTVLEGLSHTETPRNVFRLDLSVHGSGRDVFQSLLTDLGLATNEESHAALSRSLRDALARQSCPSIVQLDEFDSVVRFEDGLDFLRLLREVAHRPQVTNCAFLILSRRSLAAIEAQVRGISTLASVFVTEYVRGCTPVDLRTLWPGASGLSDEELGACVSWSGGHAPLVRYWLSVRPDRVPGEHNRHKQFTEFGRLIDHLEKSRLMDATAQLVLGPIVDEWFMERRELQQLGVLGFDTDEVSVSKSELFQECLRRRIHDLNPWGVLGATEIALRGVILERLAAAFGENWEAQVSSQHRGVQRMIESAAEKQVTDDRRFGRSEHWLAYTYPGDLTDIIMKFWTHFESVFSSGDKKYWRERLEGLAAYRTPVAHNRASVLGANDRLQCRLYAEQVMHAIEDR